MRKRMSRHALPLEECSLTIGIFGYGFSIAFLGYFTHCLARGLPVVVGQGCL